MTRLTLLPLLLAVILQLSVAAAATTACTNETATVRKEWLQLTLAERLAYITSIQCLQTQPSLLGAAMPAAQSRYHDFAAVHANQTRSIHFSGLFYGWHRQYLHLVEGELRAHCGLPAGLGVPYWDWTLPAYQAGLAASPLFDGSATSLGGNGAAVPGAGPYTTPGGAVPHGSGGGCVTAGPFANLTVPFGPFDISHLFTGLPADWAAGNPHCLRRDLNDFTLRKYNTAGQLAAVLAATTIREFQDRSAGFADLGVHGGGHFSVGETMNDPFGSPQDPVFFLHHSMLDRVWALWQAGGEGQAGGKGGRRFVYDGTSTIFNAPDSPPVGNETVLTYGVLGRDVRMWETADPMGGEYCYRYE